MVRIDCISPKFGIIGRAFVRDGHTPVSLALVESLHFSKDSAATVSCTLFYYLKKCFEKIDTAFSDDTINC